MTGPAHDAALSPGGRPAGLLEKLMAAIRPEFRAEVLAFEATDPVFGGQACAVPGCPRVARCRRMCLRHHRRWRHEGTPDLAGFIATTPSDWNSRRQLASCKVPSCQYASSSKGMCDRHYAQWKRSGEAGHASWMTSPAPLRPPSPVPPACAIACCPLWRKGRAPFCGGHNEYWRQCRPRMSMQDFTARYEADRSDQEWIDLRNLPAQLRLESAIRPAVPPRRGTRPAGSPLRSADRERPGRCRRCCAPTGGTGGNCGRSCLRWRPRGSRTTRAT